MPVPTCIILKAVERLKEQRLSKSQANCEREASEDLNIFNRAENHQVQAKGLDATKTKNKSAMAPIDRVSATGKTH